MAGNDWLSSRRAEVAADRILDAAGELFANHDVSTVGMNDIARAAGCSRATLYRYFENREVLHTAYVHRESYRLHEQMTDLVSGIPDPRERLLVGLSTSMKLVRDSPALSRWFATADSPIGAEMAEQSEVIQALTSGFLLSLRPDDPDVVHRRARWLVRVLTSLLIFPGRDAGDERAMLEEFVVPMVCPSETDSAVSASEG
jgi:AcrR family transcriptional regulator